MDHSRLRFRHAGTAAILFLLLLLASACGQAAGPAAAMVEPTASVAVPAGVVRAREAVLDFLRTGANECVPSSGVLWQDQIGKKPAGFGVYNFHTGPYLVTISYPLAGEDIRYHVGLDCADSGFCWQANVNTEGEVVATGTKAVMAPELVTVATAYCQNQGYEHSVETQPDGSRCGVCTFPGGSHCKAWLFYQGECGPDEP